MNARLHLGIDYGTSSSKMVVRYFGAPGGDRSFALSHEGAFLFPSSVAIDEGRVVFGATRGDKRLSPHAIFVDSVKMATAAEHLGKDLNLPMGLRSQQLSILTVWWLMSVAKQKIKRVLGLESYKLGMTMGIPLSFFNDANLRAHFTEISRAAFYLNREENFDFSNVISISDAKAFAMKGLELESKRPKPESLNEVRDWVRAEAEAAMWWAFRSPAVGDGPYVITDVGAGTTNVAKFRIKATPMKRGSTTLWVKDGIGFFSVDCEDIGMDSICSRIAEVEEESLAQAIEKFRRKEAQFMAKKDVAYACRHIIGQMRRPFERAWGVGREKYKKSVHEKEAWKGAKILAVGGGSLVSEIVTNFRIHPYSNEVTLDIQRSEIPDDLSMRREVNGKIVDASVPTALPFLQVAYGLASLSDSIPEIKMPDEIEPIREESERLIRLSSDDIYGK